MKTIFDLCQPRQDVQQGRVRDEEFAADLSKVVNKTAVPEYASPEVFFRYTYPTRGLKTLLETVCRRLSGAGGELNSVIRLDTQYGGGKTHSLIALTHAVRGMQAVPNAKEFIDSKFIPVGNVRVAALDGENADPANGYELEKGLYAHSIWGHMAYQLAGKKGFERVRKSDEKHVAPGADTIIELFGDEPTLILMDEVSVYLRKVSQVFPDATNQFTAFLQALIKAVSSTPRTALVMTLAVNAADQTAADAYKAEHQIALQAFDEAESVLSRTLLQIDPTEEDETVDVLRRRLFEKVDLDGAASALQDYFEVWDKNKEVLSPSARTPELRDQFRRGYPLHPELMGVMMEKMASLANFQRTRGMLRLLARTVHALWKAKPVDAFAIHPHHIDLGNSQIRSEFTTKLGQGAYAPALSADIASVPGQDPSTAQRLDQEHYAGQAPVTSYLARTIFLNTMAFGDAAQGVSPEHLRYSVCSPAVEPALVEAARKNFVADSLFLDDRPGAPMRFRVEPNLTQIIHRSEKDVNPDELRNYLNTKVKDTFRGTSSDFEMVPFPAGPYEVPDEIGGGRPYLVVLNYDALTMSAAPSELPTELARMATRKGVKDEIRTFQNNLVFVVADQTLRGDMKQTVRRRLALEALQEGPLMKDLAEYQQRKVKEEYEKSRTTVAIAILQCYRHIFYPSHTPVGSGEAKLGHTTIELPNTSDSPGNGQMYIKRALREQKKLLASGDSPDAPAYVRDQTPLRTKGELSTLELRNEFRRAPKLSILLDDDPLITCVRLGIDSGVFIYREGDIVWGKGDPAPSIRISENAFVHTLESAAKKDLWPRKPKEPEKPEPPDGPGPGGPEPPEQPEPPRKPTLSAEGPLRQALVELFGKARAGNIAALDSMAIRFFEYKPAGFLHQALATYRDAEVKCSFDVTISGDGIDKFAVQFAGKMEKVNSVRSFIDPQIRTAGESAFEGTYTLTFTTPLSMSADKSEEFIKAMTKYGGGEAYVEATAASKDKD